MESLAFESIYTTILAAAAFVYVLHRQWAARPLTRGDFLLPLVGALYLGVRYLQGGPAPGIFLIQGAAIAGITTGLFAGHLVRVWRDERTGLAYQCGGARYALIITALLAVRVVWGAITQALGVETQIGVINDAFLALTLGNYLGRNLQVGGRALHLVGWNLKLIPTRKQVRAAKRGSRRN